MPAYQYYCDKCDRNSTHIIPWKEKDEVQKCNHCENEKCTYTLDYSKSDSSKSFGFKGGDTPNFYGTHTLKGQEKQWMEGEVKNTKEALKYDSGVSPYSKVTMSYDVLEKKGVVKRVDEKTKVAKMQGAQRMASEAGEKMTKDEIKRAGSRGDANQARNS